MAGADARHLRLVAGRERVGPADHPVLQRRANRVVLGAANKGARNAAPFLHRVRTGVTNGCTGTSGIARLRTAGQISSGTSLKNAAFVALMWAGSLLFGSMRSAPTTFGSAFRIGPTLSPAFSGDYMYAIAGTPGLVRNAVRYTSLAIRSGAFSATAVTWPPML